MIRHGWSSKLINACRRGEADASMSWIMVERDSKKTGLALKAGLFLA
jgi:hypothetical protein